MKSKIKFNYTSFLVLIKDEKFFSKKLVNHINSQNIDAEFIIADGSKNKQKKIFDKLQTRKKYYYFGEDKDQKTFFLKISKGIEKCTNRFIFFCDQDDLVNFETIKNHEKFLIKNKDYSCVGGGVYSFKYIKNKIRIINQQYSAYKYDFKTFYFRYFFNIYFKSYYYLQRKKNLKKIWSLIKKHKVIDVRSAMCVTDICTLILGKIKFYDDLSVLRWAGIKKSHNKKNHFINQAHKNRYDWFKYFFSKQKILIIRILKEEKIFFCNFHIFKGFFFIFDIVQLLIKKFIGYTMLIRVIEIIKNKLTINNQYKIYKQLKLNQIIKKKYLYL